MTTSECNVIISRHLPRDLVELSQQYVGPRLQGICPEPVQQTSYMTFVLDNEILVVDNEGHVGRATDRLTRFFDKSRFKAIGGDLYKDAKWIWRAGGSRPHNIRAYCVSRCALWVVFDDMIVKLDTQGFTQLARFPISHRGVFQVEHFDNDQLFFATCNDVVWKTNPNGEDPMLVFSSVDTIRYIQVWQGMLFVALPTTLIVFDATTLEQFEETFVLPNNRSLVIDAQGWVHWMQA